MSILHTPCSMFSILFIDLRYLALLPVGNTLKGMNVTHALTTLTSYSCETL